MIKSLPDPQTASRWCATQRARGNTIGYVPTMGALHRGHLSLVERAVHDNKVTCVSIFVNPLQFNDPNDLQNYPRDVERDVALLERAGCDMVYYGTLAEFFPEVDDVAAIEMLDPGVVAHGLEGAFRPQHLHGVCTIVDRLFVTVGACNAYFGEKDFQQCLVIRDLAQKFEGVNVIICPTVREVSGLAMSSRNEHLTATQLTEAAKLYRALCAAKDAWDAGVRVASDLESIMHENLNSPEIKIEYAEIRDSENWSDTSPHGQLQHARGLLAVYVGDVRLIDTLRLD